MSTRTSQFRQNKNKRANWLRLLFAHDIHLYFHLSCHSSNCTQIQQNWQKCKLWQKKQKNGEADFQYCACVVIRYYCEPINQPRKHGKYPVPVFVPERATGLRNINTVCVCAPICVCMYWGFIPLSIMLVLLCLCACLCLCTCVCADACWYLCMLVCEHKQSWKIIP